MLDDAAADQDRPAGPLKSRTRLPRLLWKPALVALAICLPTLVYFGLKAWSNGLRAPAVRVHQTEGDAGNAPPPAADRRGHTAPVLFAAFSPDGQRIVTTSQDCTAKLWDAKAGTVLRTLRGHTRHVNMAAFAPDGSRLVTASDDGTAVVWDPRTGDSLRVYAEHQGWVSWVAFSPDGTRVVTAGRFDHTARIWEPATGHTILIRDGRGESMQAVAFSPNGRHVVSTSAGGRVWDARTAKDVFWLADHTAEVSAVDYSPDGTRIVISQGSVAKVYDATDGYFSHVLEDHAPRAHVGGATFSPDGTRVVTSCSKPVDVSALHSVKVWDVKPGEPTPSPALTIPLPRHAALSCRFSPDGARIITACGDAVRVWDARSGALLLTLANESQ